MYFINPRKRTKRFIKYTLIGTSTFLLDLIILYSLTEFLDLFYLASASVSFIFATSINYAINKSWNFTEKNVKVIKSYPIFISVNFFTLMMIVFLMGLAVEILGFNYFVSRIVIGIGIGILNFILNSKISFQTPIFQD